MSHPVLSDADVAEALRDIPGWTHEDGALTRTFRFRGFPAAIAFLVRISHAAERLNHHPEIFQVYDRVRFVLRTHDAGDRVTALDLALARAIQAAAEERPS